MRDGSLIPEVIEAARFFQARPLAGGLTRVFSMESQADEPAPWGERDPWGRMGYRWPIWSPEDDSYLLVVNPDELWTVASGIITSDEWPRYLEAVHLRQIVASMLGKPPDEDYASMVPTVDAYLGISNPYHWGLIERITLISRDR